MADDSIPLWVRDEWTNIYDSLIEATHVYIDRELFFEVASSPPGDEPEFPSFVTVTMTIGHYCACPEGPSGPCTSSAGCGEVVAEKTFGIMRTSPGLTMTVHEADGSTRQLEWRRENFVSNDDFGLPWQELLVRQAQVDIKHEMDKYLVDYAMWLAQGAWNKAMQADDPHEAPSTAARFDEDFPSTEDVAEEFAALYDEPYMEEE